MTTRRIALAKLEKKLSSDKSAILNALEVRLLTRELQRHMVASFPGLVADRLPRADASADDSSTNVVLAPSWPETLPRRDHRGTSTRFPGDLVALPTVRHERGDSRLGRLSLGPTPRSRVTATACDLAGLSHDVPGAESRCILWLRSHRGRACRPNHCGS